MTRARPRASVVRMSATIPSRPLAALAAGDVMSRGLVACAPGAPLRSVAATMALHEVHAVLLADDAPGPPRVVTDLDAIAARHAVAGVAASAARMPATVGPDEPLAAVARAMVRERRSHVVVVDGTEGVPVGMVSTFDVAAVLAGHRPGAARVARPRPARPPMSAESLGSPVLSAMHPGIFTCPSSGSAAELAATLVERRVHCVVIHLADGSGGWGVATDLDVARVATAAPDACAGDLLSAPPVWIAANASVETAAATMVRSGVSHVLVIGDREPAGVISTLDVLAVLACAP
jgi:CBS domain-containing protein